MEGALSAITRWLLPARERARLEAVCLDDAGHGYDVFGAHRDWIRFGAGLMRPLYEAWFRVSATGAEHLPRRGAAILAANHSGTLPYDAAMLWADVLRHTDPPRLLRPVLDHFVPALPFAGTLFARVGAVGGSRENVAHLLERGELLLIFPEGTVGIGKPFAKRYQLEHWRVGHVELAIRHRAPVVPVAVIGAEEQMPQIARITRGAQLFGAPYLPIPLTPLPLPVHYHVYYGAPIALAERYRPEDADRPEVLRDAAGEIRAAVAALLERGLDERQGIFS